MRSGELVNLVKAHHASIPTSLKPRATRSWGTIAKSTTVQVLRFRTGQYTFDVGMFVTTQRDQTQNSIWLYRQLPLAKKWGQDLPFITQQHTIRLTFLSGIAR